MKQKLLDTLRAVGKEVCLTEWPDGSTVAVLPYGGRILGLFSAASDENFYWTHPALDSPPTAAAFYGGPEWHNSGGDRTWLAPEVDFFFPNYPRTDVYWQPRQLDPGDWRIEAEASGPRLVNRLTCRMSRAQVAVTLEITKSVGPAVNPLQADRTSARLAHVEFAGYTLRTALRLIVPPTWSGAPVGLWNLIQMPHGGELLVPTYFATTPRVLFGTVAPDDLAVEPHCVRYAMRAAGEHKLAIRALAVAGRIGYQYAAADGRWALIVRNVLVNPSGMYVDAPWGDPEDLGYAVQACNVHSALGRFSELEYHVPAIGPGTGQTECTDVAQTWAFRGSREEITQIAATLIAAP